MSAFHLSPLSLPPSAFADLSNPHGTLLAETLSDESGASGDVRQRHPYGDQDGNRHRQAQAVTLTSEDLTTLTGGTICAIDGVHSANIVILGQYSGAGVTRSVDNVAEERWSLTTIRMLSLKERSRQMRKRELPIFIARIAAVVTFGNAEAGLID
jgi:hypothetical protein